MKGVCIDKMLNICDLELWSWPCTSKVKLLNSPIPRMWGLFDMEWKGCELIGSWNHYVTLIFNLPIALYSDFHIIFQKAISQEWESHLTWNKRGTSLIRCWTHYDPLCNLELAIWAWPWATSTYQVHWLSNGLIQDLQFPTCGPIDGLPILWYMGWGLLFSECLVC